MIKNITIGVLSFLIVFFVLFANIKANEAVKQTLLAELNLKLAEENETKAREQERKAVEAAARAIIEQQKAVELQQQLDDCNK
ncbi:MAG: hypothetical protein R8N23_04320 [Reichenbachiella sp.]|uniref:hypothetical protein n=1 Tax=Reichenbachiella sp. TaxID=2184521 RepID=UPI0029664DEA|nr:hypothetical protein [Reichenbachiella sp.]MDW3209066.1 hypothetical protein [Reichenbachiella sp.]